VRGGGGGTVCGGWRSSFAVAGGGWKRGGGTDGSVREEWLGRERESCRRGAETCGEEEAALSVVAGAPPSRWPAVGGRGEKKMAWARERELPAGGGNVRGGGGVVAGAPPSRWPAVGGRGKNEMAWGRERESPAGK
jgi:hypothetical protein